MSKKLGRRLARRILCQFTVELTFPEIIKSAFCKTGLWPFNQDVISKEDMALSKEMSCEGHFPAATAPEIAMLAKLMQDMSVASQVSTVVATALAEGDDSDDTNAVSAMSVTVASSAVATIRDVVGGIEVPFTSRVEHGYTAGGIFPYHTRTRTHCNQSWVYPYPNCNSCGII